MCGNGSRFKGYLILNPNPIFHPIFHGGHIDLPRSIQFFFWKVFTPSGRNINKQNRVVEWGGVFPHLPTKYTKAFLFSWIYLKKLLYFVEVVVYPVHLPFLPRVFSQSFFLFVPQEKILTVKLATSPPENNGLGQPTTSGVDDARPASFIKC